MGATIAAVVAVGLTAVQSRSARRFELLIAGFLAILIGAFIVQLVAAPPESDALLRGLTPRLAGPESAVSAIGILDATVMPHASTHIRRSPAPNATSTRTGPLG